MKILIIQRLLLNVRECFTVLFSCLNGGLDCLCCGNKCYNVPVCKVCQMHLNSQIVFKTDSRCCFCGRELISEQKICMECRREKICIDTDGVFPVFRYNLWNKSLLFEWKLHGFRGLSFLFAGFYNKAIISMENTIHENDLPIVPVPPRQGKLRKQGWDQIEDICSILQYRYGYTVLHLLERLTENQQKKLVRTERLLQKSSRYRLKVKPGMTVSRVILLDDIITTGATMEACSHILKNTGIEKVYAVSLFTAS